MKQTHVVIFSDANKVNFSPDERVLLACSIATAAVLLVCDATQRPASRVTPRICPRTSAVLSLIFYNILRYLKSKVAGRDNLSLTSDMWGSVPTVKKYTSGMRSIL